MRGGEAEYLERMNLGYYAGYFSVETRQRVERLFRAPHPIFGSRQLAPEEAYEAGRKMAARTKEEDTRATAKGRQKTHHETQA